MATMLATPVYHALLPRQSSTQGKNRDKGSNSLSGIISTLVPVFLVAAISFTAFLFLRKKFQRVYRARTVKSIVKEENRTPETDNGFFSWLKNYKALPDTYVLQHNSLDGYLFLRFFKVMIAISVVGVCITWPILFPVNITGGGTESQLDRLSFSNVKDYKRYFAHALVAWVFLGFVVLLVARERMKFIGLRQAYYLSTLHAQRISSRTVLFLSLPDKFKGNEEALRLALGPAVRHVWWNPDCTKLEKIIEQRDKAVMKLEGAQVKLAKQANANRLKAMSSSKEEVKSGHATAENESQRWIDEKKRPTHRLKFLIGKKVDTIHWARAEIPKLSAEISQSQKHHLDAVRKSEVVPAAFVEFSSQEAAQRAFQLAALKPRKEMRPRYVGVLPEDVVWKNLKTKYATRKVKMAIATALITLLIIFWTPFVVFVGVLTNIDSLTQKVPFLSFINKIPPSILGVVTSLLPVIILAVLMALVPVFCRLLAKFGGEPTLSAVELKTQTWYFAFQVIQVFLVTTFTSGASAVIQNILNSPGSAPALLATNLPKASNFYISYFILFGLATAASLLLNIVPLLMHTIVGKFLDSTPRKQYKRWVSLSQFAWGSMYPKWTLLGVIAISYSCIAPLILGFSTVGLTLLYLAFRYNWLFTLESKVDMKGESYARALKQLLTGVYLSTLCLIGLFAIATASARIAVGPLILMIIFLVGLIIFQTLLDRALAPLEQGLPLELLRKNGPSTSILSAGGPGVGKEPLMEDEVAGHTSAMHGATSHPAHDHEAVEGAVTSEDTKTGNFLTRRLTPIVYKEYQKSLHLVDLPHFNTPSPASHLGAHEHEIAYLNPAFAASIGPGVSTGASNTANLNTPFVWLAKDPLNISKSEIQGNPADVLESSDDYAWFEETGKKKKKPQLTWDRERMWEVPPSRIRRDILY